MSDLEWLAVALIALALAFPAGVAFGIRIGQMREQDRKAKREQGQSDLYWQIASYMPEGTEPKTVRPSTTRQLLDWSNGQGRHNTSIDEEEG